jgi:predicted transcriptional regulator
VNIGDLVKELGLTVITGSGRLDREVTSGYVSDLLSDVLAHAEEGTLWITLHVHQNIVAVASHKDLAGIILVQGRQPEKDTIAKAEEEGIPVLVSGLSAFELAGRLYKAGLRGAEAH